MSGGAVAAPRRGRHSRFDQLPDTAHDLVFGMGYTPELVRQGEGKSLLAGHLQRAQVEPIIGRRRPTLGSPGPPWGFVFKYYNRAL
eukprot:15474311-Alexandrium_andersonii.AAC.1